VFYGRGTDSTSTMDLSWLRTTILATAAGASGRRSLRRIRITKCPCILLNVLYRRTHTSWHAKDAGQSPKSNTWTKCEWRPRRAEGINLRPAQFPQISGPSPASDLGISGRRVLRSICWIIVVQGKLHSHKSKISERVLRHVALFSSSCTLLAGAIHMADPAARKVLNQLIQREGLNNKVCCDCSNPNPQWASLRCADPVFDDADI